MRFVDWVSETDANESDNDYFMDSWTVLWHWLAFLENRLISNLISPRTSQLLHIFQIQNYQWKESELKYFFYCWRDHLPSLYSGETADKDSLTCITSDSDEVFE